MVINTGFSSTRRTDAFPSGLRVLVVDDDPTWLKILEKMLKKCSYEVTTCGLAREALKLLRDRKDGFDIVISDVNMPDMDGFKLLEHVGLEMDLPVIMMSVDGETSRVMKGVQHGACDYLLKPIRMKELKNIWQHVVRKRMYEVRDIECFEDRNGPDHSNDGHSGGDLTLLKKRKDAESKHDEKDSNDPSSTKKARVVWTIELHQKFVNAVNQIGIDSDKVGPKKILDLMNVPWLTRENVASHLQKYRLYLSRIRKEDKTESSCGGVKNPDQSPKDSGGNFGLQNPNMGQQNEVNSNYGYLGTQLPVQSTDAEPLDTNTQGSATLPLSDQRKPFNCEHSDPCKVSCSQVALSHAFEPIESAINYVSFDSPVAARYPWTAEIPEMQFETEFKPHPNLDHCFNEPNESILQQHAQSEPLEPAPQIDPRSSLSESNNSGSLIDVKPLNMDQIGNDISQFSPIDRTLEPFPVYPEAFGCVDIPLDVNQYSNGSGDMIEKQGPLEQPILSYPLHSESHISDSLGSEPNYNVTLEMKSQNSSRSTTVLESQISKVLGCEPSLGLLAEDLASSWLPGGEVPLKDVGFDCVGFSDKNFPDHASEIPVPAYMPKFGTDYEYLFDCIDQGLLFS